MKHTDLQIGDYVYHKDKIVKVDVLSPSDLNLMVADENGSDGALYKDIKPIPITSEILEKNGFLYNEEKDLLTCWVGNRFIDYDLNTQYFMTCNRVRSFEGEIKFIHELQHALRLCKIDKEIKL